jgi:ABC-type nitrate/sulfonate/bicarbonate transport system permease component
MSVAWSKLPAPSVILATIWSDRSALASAVMTTLYEAVIGLLAAILFGVLSGVAFFRWRLARTDFCSSILPQYESISYCSNRNVNEF